ncbi:MAG: class I SAM-dependent methyltransferase, partial [Gemmatimonadetes bacterium]|nr:class I SAM-dependent methyltransferase [Gemmatimonadota bacterium]
MRKTSHYKNEYVWGFVDKWDELIDWDQRAQGEGDFFIRHLKKLGARRVLDVATGTGFHSVRLIEVGFEVVSADGSAEMLAKAFENGYQRGHILRTVQADWRFLNRDVHGEFDAIICLGNSFTHMFNEKDRRRALAEFYAMLKHDGDAGGFDRRDHRHGHPLVGVGVGQGHPPPEPVQHGCGPGAVALRA